MDFHQFLYCLKIILMSLDFAGCLSIILRILNGYLDLSSDFSWTSVFDVTASLTQPPNEKMCVGTWDLLETFLQLYYRHK